MGSTRIWAQQEFTSRSRAERALSPIYHEGGSTDDNDQNSDGRARGCRNGGYAPCCASEELQAHQASNLLSDVHVRPLSDGRSVGPAERRLWYIRNFRGNCHCSVNRHIQLAFGGRHQRSPHLEQHHSRRSLSECRLARSRRIALARKPLAADSGQVRSPSMTEQRACPVAGGKILRRFFRNMYFIPSILILPGGAFGQSPPARSASIMMRWLAQIRYNGATHVSSCAISPPGPHRKTLKREDRVRSGSVGHLCKWQVGD